jgi:4-hydroxybenzoate polyprenyltransferase/phosphoserine phosphatase
MHVSVRDDQTLAPSEVRNASVVCVDLDGTLIAGDLLWESFLELIKRKPLRAVAALLGLFKGKAYFKRLVAVHAAVDVAHLPYREEVLKELHALRIQGSCLVLATAADEIHARAVAEHLGIFTDVLASDGRRNLSGGHKAAVLCERYGDGGFDYFGNDWADVPVWRTAARAAAVCAAPRLVRHVNASRPLSEIGQSRPGMLNTLVKAMRPHQWVKNLLVFVPLFASHKFIRPELWVPTTLTFVAFCLCASAIYLMNDVLDVQADRQHPRKRSRPFAAGHLSIPFGIAASAGLLMAGIALAAFGVSTQVALIAIAYVASTTTYSMYLKRKPVTDVFMLTGLYVLRVFAGGVASETPPSSWLLGFALFFFLSLAWLKRYAEVVTTEGWLAGRGYRHEDSSWMQAIGTSAGYMAIVVLALYLTAPDVAVLYRRPQVLWLLCPLFLFWLTRMWLRAGRGLVQDDPVVEALKDPHGYLVLAAAAFIMFAAV